MAILQWCHHLCRTLHLRIEHPGHPAISLPPGEEMSKVRSEKLITLYNSNDIRADVIAVVEIIAGEIFPAIRRTRCSSVDLSP